MVSTASFSELIDQCANYAEDAGELYRDSSRLVAGWHKIDKVAMTRCIQSFYHMSWNLKDLRDSMEEITGVKAVQGKSRLEDIRFDDHDDLTAAMLRGRTKNWYAAVKQMHQGMRRILAVMETVDARPFRVSFIMARIYLDIHFFKDQYEQATGEKLEN